MTSSASEKRCLYEVLGLKRDCTSDEIRSAYRKLALQRHPDKLIKSGITEAEATASFQELVNAYEVLSDARERAWYDSHRSQILFSGKRNSSRFESGVPDLFKYFTNSVYSGFGDRGKGFYKVYGDVFDKIFRNELSYVAKSGEEVELKEAPLFGNSDSGHEQVNAFYGYWFGFATVMDFAWVDEFDVMSGNSRKSRRVMEEENKKIRKKARREFNETVRGLAEFVKKRDKRVIDMQLKRNEENERKKEEEKLRKAELAREKAERARMFQVPDWAKVEEVEDEEDVVVEEEKRNELYCVVCGKKFKSDKQWKNHEQSKKHKEKMAELREAFVEENGDDDDGEVEGDGDECVSADEVEKVKERFDGVEIREEEKGEDDPESEVKEEDGRESEAEEEYVDVDNGEKGLDGNESEDDDEDSVLKAMLKNRKKKNVYVEVEEEEVDLMEYNNTKGRRRRGGRKETAQRDEDEEPKETDKPKTSSKPELGEESDNGSNIEEPTSSKPFTDNEKNDGGDDKPRAKIKVPKQAAVVKVTNKKEVNSKGKNSARGKKQKASTSRSSGHECDTCGVDFDSRTKLFKHLSDTGHATLKSR
uniref:DNAJ protein JJJ1 homolog n=1 Tax=Erigeron canadensis TaxID=72917 RepID=UPI001CB9878F|nr:DNAJ protein JJJ1 homolog [Erigeron canadensis]